MLRVPLIVMALALSSAMPSPTADEPSLTPLGHEIGTAIHKTELDNDADEYEAMMTALESNMTSKELADIKTEIMMAMDASKDDDGKAGDKEAAGSEHKVTALMSCNQCNTGTYVKQCMREDGLKVCKRSWCKSFRWCRRKCQRRCHAWTCTGGTRSAQPNKGNICHRDNCFLPDTCNA